MHISICQTCATPKIIIFIFLKNKIFFIIPGKSPFLLYTFLQLNIVSFLSRQTQICSSAVNPVNFCLDRLFLEVFYVFCQFYCLDLWTNGQQLNCDVINVLNKIRLLRCDKYYEILDNMQFLAGFSTQCINKFAKCKITIDGNSK